MNTSWCEDCDYNESSSLPGRAFSSASWHNTNTGHDVAVDLARESRADAVSSWRLTDAGWEEV